LLGLRKLKEHWKISNRSAACRDLLFILAEIYYKPGDEFDWPTMTILSRCCNCSIDTIGGIIREMEDLGLVVVKNDVNDRRKKRVSLSEKALAEVEMFFGGDRCC
jgi:DNA-binding MarR family transcriptional regulator